MQVTVLGKSNAWPDAGGACSGYLIQQDEFRLLLDCGTGVFAKLRGICDYRGLDAILISHLHADHFLDLIPFSYALTHSTVAGHATRPLLFAPPGAAALFAELGRVLGFGDQLERCFELREYDGESELELGPLRVRFREVPHFVQAFACELTAAGSGRFTYGSDCGYNDALVEFARGTDLLVLEATDGDRPELEPAVGAGHMNALQAGRLARAAGARRVVLSHYSDELDARLVGEAGARGFGAEVALAREAECFTV